MKFRNIPIDANCTYDFVVLNSCTYSNPNGDPDFDNQPRRNPETGCGEITNDCLKRRSETVLSSLWKWEKLMLKRIRFLFSRRSI